MPNAPEFPIDAPDVGLPGQASPTPSAAGTSAGGSRASADASTESALISSRPAGGVRGRLDPERLIEPDRFSDREVGLLVKRRAERYIGLLADSGPSFLLENEERLLREACGEMLVRLRDRAALRGTR